MLAEDEQSGRRPQQRHVVEAYERQVEVVVDLVVESGGRSELISTTLEHPFLVEENGKRSWRGAGELRAGESLVTTRGSAHVERVTLRRETTRVFNLNVEAAHTYVVGATQSVVHNANCLPGDVPTDAAKGPTLEIGKQGKHIPGHNNYIPGRSPLTHKDPQGLLDKFAGKGDPVGNVPRGQPGFKERVDFGEVIGEVGGNPTTKGIIHYSKDGAHIVPANP